MAALESSPPTRPRFLSRASTTFSPANPTEDSTVHTYTLCLVGYLDSFLSSSSSSIKEIPVQVDSAIVAVSCGADWLCLLTDQGRVYSFGNNTYGQLAQGHFKNVSYPKPMAFSFESKKISKISCGTSHGGFVLESGALFMFGCGSYGRLGTGNDESQSTPVAVVMFWKELDAKAIQLGLEPRSTIPGVLPTVVPKPAPIAPTRSQASDGPGGVPQHGGTEEEDPVRDDVVFSDVSCGDRHTVLLGARTTVVHGRNTVQHHIITFGDGMNGRLGLGSERDQSTGAVVVNLQGSPTSYTPAIVSVSAGAAHNAAISSAGEVFTWGNGADGQLGHGTTESEWVPRQVQFFRGTTMASAKCGAKHTVAVSRQGVVYAWGRGVEGQLGLGTATPPSSCTKPHRISLVVDPIAAQQAQIDAQFASFSSPSASMSSILVVPDMRVLVHTVVAKAHTTLALDEHSRLFVWGDNSSGQLGESTTAAMPEPGRTMRNPKGRHTGHQPNGTTPRQLLYMDLHEPASRATAPRDRTLQPLLPRVALTHVDASDRFSLLVFRTKAPTGLGSGSGRLDTDTPVAVEPPRDPQRPLLQTSSNTNNNSSKWQFAATEKLHVSDIPSREPAFYNYMAQYKVHIRSTPTPPLEDEDTQRSGGVSETNRRSSVSAQGRRHGSVVSALPDGPPPTHTTTNGNTGGNNFSRPAAQAVRGFSAWLERRNHVVATGSSKALDRSSTTLSPPPRCFTATGRGEYVVATASAIAPGSPRPPPPRSAKSQTQPHQFMASASFSNSSRRSVRRPVTAVPVRRTPPPPSKPR